MDDVPVTLGPDQGLPQRQGRSSIPEDTPAKYALVRNPLSTFPLDWFDAKTYHRVQNPEEVDDDRSVRLIQRREPFRTPSSLRNSLSTAFASRTGGST